MKKGSGLTMLGLVALYIGLVVLMAAAPADKKAAAPAPTAAGASANQPAHAEVTGPRRIVVYYFHTTQRCPTCHRIEEWSELALRTAFGKELADSSLVFLAVNTDEKGNEHFVKDFQLYTKSLVVTDMTGGTRQHWDNLQKVWEFSGSQEKFFSYVQDEVRKYLAGNQVSDRG